MTAKTQIYINQTQVQFPEKGELFCVSLISGKKKIPSSKNNLIERRKQKSIIHSKNSDRYYNFEAIAQILGSTFIRLLIGFL